MNGYLRSKCSSEQQLLNELAKLLGAKDVASRKMADVLRALTFFYTSAARGSRIPQSLLSGLCSLLPQLKDKKEITLLKDEHQRIARIALCLLARLIDQFEIQKEMATRLADSQERNDDPVEQALTNFLLTLETAVTTPPGLLLPRQRATLRVYAQLCRAFHKREQLVTHATTLLQQSPVLAFVENPVDAKGKRVSPPAPAQYGAVTGACHALRFHTTPDEQVFAVDRLAQLAFMTPASAASRHAAKTLLSLVTSSVLKEDKQTNAVTAAKALELYLLKTRPRALLNGDSLTSVYLLRLCGQMYRLPVHQQQQQSSAANSRGATILETTLLETSSSAAPKQTSDQNPALRGFFVSNAMSAQLQEYLMDVIQAAVPNDPTAKSTVGPAVLLVAAEETLRGTSPEASFRKQPTWGSKCIFELVATALLSLLPASQDSTGLAYSTVMLHRVCRAVQFVAERLDAVVLQLSAVSGETIVIPSFLNELTQRIRSLTAHSNAFVACEALRAFVWLLPRCNKSMQTGDKGDGWGNVFWQLESLPFNRIQPERRAAIAWTLFRRCVTTLKAYGYEVEAPLLSGCLRVVLAWFRARPCVWHAAMLTAIWHTALRECLTPLGDAVFSSINDLFDYHCDPLNCAAPDCLVVKQSALQFLSHREGGMKYAVRSETWSRPLVLRLTKQALLETSTSQRLSTRALSQMRDEAQTQDFARLAQQVDATLSILQKKPRHLPQIAVTNSGGLEDQAFSLHEDPFVDVTRADDTDKDPFSDFRAPQEATLSSNTKPDDPFADVTGTNSTPDTSFTNWDGDSATNPPSIGDFKAPADTSFSKSWGEAVTTAGSTDTKAEAFSTSPFSSWDDGSSIKEEVQATKTEETFFGSFSATGNTSESAFSAWGESETRHESFNRGNNSFSNFGTSISASTTEAAAFSTDFGAAETADFDSPADTPAFDSGADAERPASFTADTSGRTPSFTSDTQQASVSASTTEAAAFSTDFGAAETAECDPNSAVFDESERKSTVLADVPYGTGENSESEVATSDNRPARLDEFDEIFGDSSGSAGPIANLNATLWTGEIPTSQPSTDKYDAEFDDIFGEGTSATDGATTSMPTPADFGKKHNLDEDNSTTGVEVRTGTPASDFSLS